MTDAFVTVATFATLPEAEAARLQVESTGIPAIIVDAEIVSMDWLLGNAVGYIKLQVPSSQVQNAALLLESHRIERQRRRELAAETNDESCLACGAVMNEVTTCPECGWTWAEPAENSADH